MVIVASKHNRLAIAQAMTLRDLDSFRDSGGVLVAGRPSIKITMITATLSVDRHALYSARIWT